MGKCLQEIRMMVFFWRILPFTENLQRTSQQRPRMKHRICNLEIVQISGRISINRAAIIRRFDIHGLDYLRFRLPVIPINCSLDYPAFRLSVVLRLIVNDSNGSLTFVQIPSIFYHVTLYY